jgi:hypothetical protein
MEKQIVRNILYIIPTHDWSTRERLAFRDMNLSKKLGHKVYLCTYEDSFLAKCARHLSIEIIPFKVHFINSMTVFHKHFSLKSLFKKIGIDIIHCYDFSLLLSLSIQLKTQNLVALIMTQDHLIDKPLQRFLFKPLISRIDSLIMVNKNLKQDARGNLDLTFKKIEYFGIGLKSDGLLENELVTVDFDLYKDYFLAGTYISPEGPELKTFTPLISALKVINEKSPGGKKSKLVFLSAVDFQTLSILPEIMRLIQEQELQDDVLFVTTSNVDNVLPHFNVWISNRENELIEDFAISALLHEVPAIMPRNFCTKDFLEDYVGVGETYKLYDARELRDKLEKIILGNAVFKEKARVYKYFIERDQSLKSYQTHLFAVYTRAVQRRVRLFAKK